MSVARSEARSTAADPADWPVAPGWQPLVDEFFAGAVGQKLLGFLRERLDGRRRRSFRRSRCARWN